MSTDTTTTYVPRLKAKYNDEIRDQLQESLGLGNVMEVPRLEKIVINVGAAPPSSSASSSTRSSRTSRSSPARSRS